MFLKAFERSLSKSDMLSQAGKPCAYFSWWGRSRQNQIVDPDPDPDSNLKFPFIFNKDNFFKTIGSSKPKEDCHLQTKTPNSSESSQNQEKVNQLIIFLQRFRYQMSKPNPLVDAEKKYQKFQEDYPLIMNFLLHKIPERLKGFINDSSYLKNIVDKTLEKQSDDLWYRVGYLSITGKVLKAIYDEIKSSSPKRTQSQINMAILISVLIFMFIGNYCYRKSRNRCRRAFNFLPAPLAYLLLEEEKKKKTKISIGWLTCPSLDPEHYLLSKDLSTPNQSPKFLNMNYENHFFLRYFQTKVSSSRTGEIDAEDVFYGTVAVASVLALIFSAPAFLPALATSMVLSVAPSGSSALYGIGTVFLGTQMGLW